MSRPPVRSVTVAVLTWNGRHHLESLLPALAAQRNPGVEWHVLLLDNGSVDGTARWVREEWEPKGGDQLDLRLVRSDVNLGFCGGNERLVEIAEGDAVVLLNDDTRPKPDWLAALVDALRAAPDDVAAVSGAIIDWSGERLDFARGLLTFDGHAFQQGFGRPLAGFNMPAAGTELLFPCGGNVIVRKGSYRRAGGFDTDYFAYLEDVDLGWRLWAGGERVVFSPDAVVHHRSMATSSLLGNANRGFLFERNAFLTAYKNFDDAHWQALAPAIWLTLVHRIQTLLVQNNPGGSLLTLDPYAGLIANTAAPSAPASPSAAPPPASSDSPAPASEIAEVAAALAAARKISPVDEPAVPRTSLRQKWRGYGPRNFFQRAVRKALRAGLPSWVFDDGTPRVAIEDAQTYAHLRAMTWLFANLDRLDVSRQRVQARRQRSDEEIFERFPLALVPTYPGDERLFASAGFQASLPTSPRLERMTLTDVLVTESAPDGV